MSIAAVFYTFGKRVNSTLQPSGGTQFDIVLKTPTSMTQPTIQLQTSNPTGYNYCYIAHFSRYYYVGDWTCIHNDLWEVTLKVDAMASFKSSILGGTHYVLRSASSYDGDIIDNLYPIKGNTTLYLSDFSPSSAKFNTGDITYIIGILNNNSSPKFGAVQYYTVTETQLGKLMSFILGSNPGQSDDFWEAMYQMFSAYSLFTPEAQDQMLNSMVNPLQYIVESYALPYKPYDPNSIPTAQQLKVGPINLGWARQGTPLPASSTQRLLFSGSLDLPEHPQKNDRGPYLNLDPFMKYWLYLGPFGLYPVDAVTVYSTHTITYDVSGDLMGNITMVLYVDGKQIDILHANVKCNFPVGQVSMDVSRAASSALNIGGSVFRAMSGDPSALVSGASGIVSAADAIAPKVRTQGAQGTFVNVFDNFNAYGEAHWVVDDNNTERGRPLCKSVTLSTLSGYCLCSEAEVIINGTADEAAVINNYLNTGFFIE